MSNIINALFPIWGDNFNFRFFAGAYATPAPGAGYDPVRYDGIAVMSATG